jgi:hypothetical protein
VSENGPTTKPEREQARRVSDPELIAMHEMLESLDRLDPDTQAQGRVVAWLRSKFEAEHPF